MPMVIIEGPKADVETKRELVRRITEVVREVYKVHHVSVIIHENETENVGYDGELLSDIIARRRGVSPFPLPFTPCSGGFLQSAYPHPTPQESNDSSNHVSNYYSNPHSPEAQGRVVDEDVGKAYLHH